MSKMLTDLDVGQAGKIVELTTNDRKMLAILMRLGIIPGASLRLLRQKPALVIQIGHSKAALGRDLAAFVRISPLL
ncbi:MAG: ferrous iron transport protein A [Firmicutes bacterium]|mgnify:CR=1 FL=1|nr:ferrous iron transport protein A [Bacillota bacterium]